MVSELPGVISGQFSSLEKEFKYNKPWGSGLEGGGQLRRVSVQVEGTSPQDS